jgi:hypothetical protein
LSSNRRVKGGLLDVAKIDEASVAATAETNKQLEEGLKKEY